LIYYLVLDEVALAEALADEAEGLAGGLMGALKDLQAELKGALHLCHAAALPHTPHGSTSPLALPLGLTITDSLQHHIMTACDYQSGKMGKRSVGDSPAGAPHAKKEDKAGGPLGPGGD